MRVNVYSEELTSRCEVLEKNVEGGRLFGLRLYLELPIAVPSSSGHTVQHRGPFIHKPGDDDSSAVTIWAKSLEELDALTIVLNSAVRRRINNTYASTYQGKEARDHEKPR